MARSILLAIIVLGLLADSAFAQNLIRREGAHSQYATEVEPHLLFDFPDGVGVGARATFNVADHGFIRNFNDSVGVGVGGDLAFHRNTDLLIPVVMQWNFWFTPKWSAFGEPGFAFRFARKGDLHPHIGAGGRLQFNDDLALTLRVGWPASSLGVSFFL